MDLSPIARFKPPFKRVVPSAFTFESVAEFDGVNDNAVPTAGMGPGTGQFPTTYPARFSISFWFRLDEPTPPGNASVFVWGNNSGSGTGFFSFTSQSGGFRFRTSVNNQPVIGAYTQGVWQFITLTFDTTNASTGMKFYVNGQFAGEAGWGGVAGTQFQLGYWINYLQMSLDEFAVFEEKLTAKDINSLYNQGNGHDARAIGVPLLAYYKFNDSLLPGRDSSGNDRHLTLQNGASLQTYTP